MQQRPSIPIPPTTIPEKYHRYEKSPILPSVLTENETTVYKGRNPIHSSFNIKFNYTDTVWQKTWFPSAHPNDRREVSALSQTLDEMLRETGLDPDDRRMASPSAFSVAQIEREQEIYEIIMNEIVRQLYVESADRAVLLERVSKRYRNLFFRIPDLLLNMQSEIDSLVEANKSLRMLLDRLMKDKSTAETNINDEMLRLANLEEDNVNLTQQLLASETQCRE